MVYDRTLVFVMHPALLLAVLDEPAVLRRNFPPFANGPRPTLGELQRTTPWV